MNKELFEKLKLLEEVSKLIYSNNEAIAEFYQDRNFSTYLYSERKHLIERILGMEMICLNLKSKWQAFLNGIKGTLNDDLIFSIFKNIIFIGFEPDNNRIILEVSPKNLDHKHFIYGTREYWLPILKICFNPAIDLCIRTEGIEYRKSGEIFKIQQDE